MGQKWSSSRKRGDGLGVVLEEQKCSGTTWRWWRTWFPSQNGCHVCCKATHLVTSVFIFGSEMVIWDVAKRLPRFASEWTIMPTTQGCDYSHSRSRPVSKDQSKVTDPLIINIILTSLKANSNKIFKGCERNCKAHYCPWGKTMVWPSCKLYGNLTTL